MTDELYCKDLFAQVNDLVRPLFENALYPWEILPHIGGFLEKLTKDGIDGFHFYGENILVAENVSISPTAVLSGPCMICEGADVRPGAFIRGNAFVGKGAVVGNSTELKNCILLDSAQAPHYNYIGDSILGNRAHMGAGSVCSNLKADGKAVVVHGKTDFETHLRKVGAFLGDYADIGCGCVLNPGTVIGRHTSVYPLLALRGTYPANSIVNAPTLAVKRL